MTAFDTLYCDHSERILISIRAELTGSTVNVAEDAFDVSQRTWMDAYALLESGRDCPASLLTTIAHRNVQDHRRSCRTAAKNSAIEIDGLEAPDKCSFLGDSRPFHDEERTGRVIAAIDRLPIQYQTVLRAAYVDGMTLGMIAQRETATVGSIQRRLSRARTALADLLGIRDDEMRLVA